MRKVFIAALTVALVTAPAWAHGASVSVKTPYNFYVPNIAVGEPHPGGNGHGGHGGHGGYNQHRHGKHCRFVPGHYETYYQQVWVPGFYRNDYVQPVYTQKRVGNAVITVCVSQGYYTKVWVPGHYTTKTRQVWRDGYWACGHYR